MSGFATLLEKEDIMTVCSPVKNANPRSLLILVASGGILTICQSALLAAPPRIEFVAAAGIQSVVRPDRLPPGSFLKEPARNIDELQLQLIKRPEVSSRYAHTINMTPKMIRLAFSRLHLTALKSDSYLEVYYCHPTSAGEVIGFKKRRFKTGTKVFALADGTPALIQLCGNPTRQLQTLANSLHRSRANIAMGQPGSGDLIPDWDPTEPVIARSTPEIALEPTSPTPVDFEEVPNSLLSIPEEPSLPISRLAPYSEQTLSEWVRGIPRGSFNFLAPGLGIAGGLAGIGFGLTGGRTSDTGITLTPNPSSGTTPQGPGPGGVIIPTGPSLVPEPGSIALAIVTAASGGMFWLRTRRSRSTRKAN